MDDPSSAQTRDPDPRPSPEGTGSEPEPGPEEEGRSGLVLDGKYRLLGLLGQGGMGSVYEAEHLGLTRRVAIKMLSRQYMERPHATLRFERESRVAATIGHENIVAVHDVGKTGDGEPYLVMERLEGCSLKDLLDRDEQIPPTRLVALMEQVLAGLQAAHDRHVVHRDIKPENIFLCPGDRGERVKILDFGISKEIRTDQSETLDLTRTGAMMGTPLYMSPEQAVGLENIDLRADLHAVGVILYRALSGHHPRPDLNYNVLIASLVSCEARPLSDTVPGVHPAWEKLVARALARDRKDRFQTARELRDALRALPQDALGNDPLPARDLDRAERAAPSPRGSASTTLRGPRPLGGNLLVVAGGLGIVALGLAIGFFNWSGRPAPAAPAAPAAAPPSTPAPAAAAPDAAPATPPLPAPEAVAEPTTIRVRINITPGHATLRVNGEPRQNPLDAVLPRQPEAWLEIEGSAPGHMTQTQRFRRDSDIHAEMPLASDGRRPRTGSSPGGAGPKRLRMKKTLE